MTRAAADLTCFAAFVRRRDASAFAPNLGCAALWWALFDGGDRRDLLIVLALACFRPVVTGS